MSGMDGRIDGAEAARQYLAALLPRVMQDGRLDEAEQQDLMRFLKAGLLGKDDVRAVFRDFLRSLRDEVLADGVLTDDERERCRAVVRELRIPRPFLSPEMTAIVDGTPLPMS